ncbi:MAG: DnaD domain protein [Solobacterium sp.]|nr:DnaD domain protein [Solobacterium sp.]
MELKGKDVYRVQRPAGMSQEMIVSLFSLYQPVIGNNPVTLYMTLYSEGLHQRTLETHARLSALAGLSVEELERARIRLEEFKLAETYMEERAANNSYIYVLHAPLPVQAFLDTAWLKNAFVSAVGTKQAEITFTKYAAESLSFQNYRNVTRQLKHLPQDREYSTEVEYRRVRPAWSFSQDETAIRFDYEDFLSKVSRLVFPVELRTEENLRLIGQLATVYGISPDRMIILLKSAVDLETMTFHEEKLRFAAERAKTGTVEAKDPYDLPPVSFLQSKQNGVPVGMTARKILENLYVEKHFAPDVINIMIEYILQRSNNRLIPSFVDSIADEWARDGVVSREDAIRETKKPVRNAPAKKRVRPEYLDKLNEEYTEDATEEEKQRIEELMKQMEADSGKVHTC